jgi:hypothetical protein
MIILASDCPVGIKMIAICIYIHVRRALYKISIKILVISYCGVCKNLITQDDDCRAVSNIPVILVIPAQAGICRRK